MEHNFCPYCMSPVEEGKPCGACGLTQGSYTPSPHHLPPGTVLKDRYLVGRVLGEGGFGITYIGCDLQLELKVAIKEYFPTDKASRVSQASLEVSSYTGAAGVNYDKGLEKFLQEARTIARMDKQPTIVNVRDFFQANHTAYIVMEYVEGTTFKELVEQRGGRLPAGELLYRIEPLFFALKEMHGNGLIHRDISPENLMIEKGEVRLLDFGCARQSADGGNTLTIALKHGYAPVEQYQSKGQGPWTDVYALSATIYYCLTGKKPPQAMDRLVEDELVPPRKLGVDLTQRQEKALLYGMGVAPRRRFQSMEEFHTALYEGFVPGAAEEKDSKTEPAAAAADAGGVDSGERTVETAPAEDKPAPSFDPAAWLKRNRLLAGGAAAALALVILLAALLPRLLGPRQEGTPGAPSQGLESQPGTQSTDPARSMTASSEHSLLSQLEDDTVDSVVVPAGIWLKVSQPVTLTKPLRIEKDGGVDFRNGLTVAQGGRVEVEGSLDSIALLRTVDGGTVSVGSGGELYTHMLWLEREDGLTRAPDGRIDVWGEFDPTQGAAEDPWHQSHYLVLDQEALLADAVHVSTEEEFIQHCQGEKPLVIDGEVTLTHFRETSVPILISEGAVLDAPCDDTADCTLDLVRGGVIVNRGTLRGRVGLMGNYEDIGHVPRLLNLGRAEVCLNSFGGASSVINLGELAFRGGFDDEPLLEDAALANLGQVTIGPGVRVTQKGNWSTNGGTITVSGGTYTVEQNTSVNNFGAISLKNGACLVNGGEIHDYGAISVASDSSLEGPGVIWPSGDPDPEPSPTGEAAEPQPTAASASASDTVRIGGRDVPFGVTELDLTEMGISDISPLAELTSLEVLVLRDNPVSDLSPLAGLTKLKRLDLFHTQVSDVSPLRGITGLATLFLDGTRVSDISPLVDLTGMTELHLDDTQVSDVSALSGMTAMDEVTFCGCPVRDIFVLRNMTELRDLRLNGTQVTDLSPLYGLHLDMLMVDRGQFTQQQLDDLTATQPPHFKLKYAE